METSTITTAIQIAQALEGSTPSTGDSIAGSLVGECLLIRTVTMTLTGRVTRIDAELIELESAAWIADTGRFADALSTGKLSEVEPFPSKAWIQRSSVVDMAPWDHTLPRTQK